MWVTKLELDNLLPDWEPLLVTGILQLLASLSVLAKWSQLATAILCQTNVRNLCQ
jgi:hypothetical protein